MAQTRMFRDRVVSMEQTLEGGEKHLELLKTLCLEAFPDFRYREHALDHERDLFVMILEADDGRRKSLGWTRMMLFDAERIPSVVADPFAALRGRIVAFLRQANRPEIVVSFRHLEEGWTDTPEPRPSRRRRRRGGGRGPGRPPERAPQGRPAAPRPAAVAPSRPAAAASTASRPAPPPAGSRPPGAGAAPPGEGSPGGSRRRFRRRRRGRGGRPGPQGAPRKP